MFTAHNHKGECELKTAGKALSVGLLALSSSLAYSGAMGPVSTSNGKIYAGVFGGGGSLSSTDMHQFGTAFFIEGLGGPLAVNAFGKSESTSMGMVGGQIGYSWLDMGTNLPVTPAVELEGYYIGGVELTGHEVNNNTVRLREHDFLVTYPMNTGVFLINGVLSANNSMFGSLKPYIGVGIGSALVSISDASSIQFAPPEPGLNHFNGHTDATAFAFAAQPKVGVSYSFSDRTRVFAEYRFLYLSETEYTFGSTIELPGMDHAETSPWTAKIQPQYYNMGTVGIQFDL